MKKTSAYRYFVKKMGIRRQQFWTAIALCVYTLCLYALIVLLQQLVDMITRSQTLLQLQELWLPAMLFLLFMGATYVSQRLFNRLPAIGRTRLLKYLYEVLLRHETAWFTEHGEAQIASILQNDAMTLAGQIATNSVIWFYQGTALVVCAVLMLWYQPLLTLLLFLLIGLCFLCTGVITKTIAHLSKQTYEQKEQMMHKVLEALQNMHLLRQLKKERFFTKRFHSFMDDSWYPLEKRTANTQSLYLTIWVMLVMGLPIFCVGIGIFFVANGMLSVGGLLAMYALASQTQEPIRQLAECMSVYKTDIELAERIMQEIVTETGTAKRTETIGPIERIDVHIPSFAYGTKVVLQDMAMTLAKGECVLLEGESGSGKSTLASLLMQYLTDADGNIEINGVESNTITLSSLYEHMLMAEQQQLIMEASIRDNITMYDTYTEEELQEVLDVCQLRELVAEKGLAYILRPHAANVSGGQLQRIALARMLIRKPDVLILDEPTSALDEACGMALAQALKAYSERYGIALLIISHKQDIKSIAQRRYCLSV